MFNIKYGQELMNFYSDEIEYIPFVSVIFINVTSTKWIKIVPKFTIRFGKSIKICDGALKYGMDAEKCKKISFQL